MSIQNAMILTWATTVFWLNNLTIFLFFFNLFSTQHPTIVFLNKSNTSIYGFPGGSVVKNPPANARDMGSIPGLQISLMTQSS